MQLITRRFSRVIIFPQSNRCPSHRTGLGLFSWLHFKATSCASISELVADLTFLPSASQAAKRMI